MVKRPIQLRLEVLRKLADLIDARAEELAQIATQEMGKLIGESREEVWIIAVIARYYADNAERFLGIKQARNQRARSAITSFRPMNW
jgi:succinate-semialdehyde dehydrogenase/glutarate-semialdehyde dehydrogenase